VSDIDATGGIVPYLARPAYYHNSEKLNWFNETFCNEKGENLSWNDDGHYHWMPPGIFRSHHLRSSWLFKKEAVESVGLFEEWAGPTGFGEETITCLKMLDKGWQLYTDVNAKAWHLVATDPKKRDMAGKPYQERIEENRVKMRKVLKPYLKRLHKKKIIKDGQGNLV
jgi:GT2 family glycosyltransferase